MGTARCARVSVKKLHFDNLLGLLETLATLLEDTTRSQKLRTTTTQTNRHANQLKTIARANPLTTKVKSELG
jgi:hypothetical protein